jgi:hypothetical protein
MAKPISQINTDRDPRLFHPSYSSANLLHWLVSFCTSSACEQINLLRETSRLIPSEGAWKFGFFPGVEEAAKKACFKQKPEKRPSGAKAQRLF